MQLSNKPIHVLIFKNSTKPEIQQVLQTLRAARHEIVIVGLSAKLSLSTTVSPLSQVCSLPQTLLIAAQPHHLQQVLLEPRLHKLMRDRIEASKTVIVPKYVAHELWQSEFNLAGLTVVDTVADMASWVSEEKSAVSSPLTHSPHSRSGYLTPPLFDLSPHFNV